MKSLLLDVARWDLVIDASGNLAIAEDPYALAQDVACAVRTFLGEVYFDDTLGVPYQQKILGHTPPVSLVRYYIEQAALSVEGVASATCTITAITGRQVQGQVTFTSTDGETGSVSLSNKVPTRSQGNFTADSSITADSSNLVS